MSEDKSEKKPDPQKPIIRPDPEKKPDVHQPKPNPNPDVIIRKDK